MAEQKPEQISRDEDWKARELKEDALVSHGTSMIDLPYQLSEFPDREVHHYVSFSRSKRVVRVGSNWKDGDDATVNVQSHLTPEQALELAHDLQQAALAAEDS